MVILHDGSAESLSLDLQSVTKKGAALFLYEAGAAQAEKAWSRRSGSTPRLSVNGGQDLRCLAFEIKPRVLMWLRSRNAQ